MQAIGLIGKSVTFTTEQGTQQGTVSALSWAGTVPQLSVQLPGGRTALATLSQVTLIK